MDLPVPVPTPIRTTETVEVYGNRFGRLFDNHTVGPTGRPGRYLRWVWAGRGVVVVPVDGDRVGLWPMYRYPIDAVSLEFPRGSVDEAESIEDAARRELREETGLAATDARVLGAVHAESGLIGSNVTVVAAQVRAARVGQRGIEPMESIGEHARWLTTGEVVTSMATGELTCAITIAAWALHMSRTS